MRTALTIAVVLGLSLHAGAESARSLQRALPGGWKLVSGPGSLTIERTQRVKIAGRYHPNAQHYTNVHKVAEPDAPDLTLRLEFRTEPVWSAAKHAQVTAANDKLYAALSALRTRYRIDDIRTAKGIPLPETPEEKTRLRDYQTAYDQTLAKIVRPPRCTIEIDGKPTSLFDDDTTYEQLNLMVYPPIAMREAFAIVELVKRRCR